MQQPETATYLKTVEAALRQGNATEHTHRAALEHFIEATFPGTDAVNEPTRSECGAPDYVVAKTKPRLTIGYIEAKDVGADLRAIEKSDQIKRYLSLPNLLLTDYLGFRWYTNGEFRAAASLGEWNGKAIVPATDGGTAALALLADFIQQAPQPIRSARALAVRLAVLAHHVRDIIAAARTHNSSDLLRAMQMAFSTTLVPEISIADFADMLAQTIAYGLFAARCADPSPDFSRDEAMHLMPRSNPFLQKLFQFIAGSQIDDEPFIGFVDDMVDVLAHADMPAVLRDFGTYKKGEDPIVHFYETFLDAYDPAMRAKRGVYYTATPIAGYMVRSIDYLLKSVFKLAAGLADGSTCTVTKPLPGTKDELSLPETHPRVLILDAACGTCTFFYVLINFLRDQFMARNLPGQWPDFVKTNLLPRLFGFELLMAPYAVAHLKLGMQLAGFDLPHEQREQWAYPFDKGERLGIYLTNTLEEGIQRGEEFWTRFLSEESNLAAAVKRDKPIMVVLGNPPYSGHSANKSWDDEHGNYTFIGRLLQDYYPSGDDGLKKEKNPKWLQDDYVKFMRWGQWRIAQSGSGILAFITNHGYLDNPTFRKMRRELLSAFNHIYILNLHGNQRKKETTPDGSRDENVFDIQQGVAIAFFVKEQGNPAPAKVQYADLWGARDAKYHILETKDLQHTKWKTVAAAAPFHLFIPQDDKRSAEYANFLKITDIMPVHSVGIVTARDKLAVQFTKEEMWRTINDFVALPPDEARRKYDLGPDARDWTVKLAQEDLRASGPTKEKLCPILYRPFDKRVTYYTGKDRGFHCRPRTAVMRHMVGHGNMALCTTRGIEISAGWNHTICSDEPIQLHSVSLKEANYIFPLFLASTTPKEGKGAGGGSAARYTMMLFEPDQEYAGRQPNIAPAVLAQCKSAFGKPVLPEHLFYYIYAVLHSPTYRLRYAEFLKIDFPRIPLTQNRDMFDKLAALGDELAALHLMTSPALASCENPLTSPVQYPATGDDVVEKVRYADGKVFINKAQHFTPVHESVWQFKIGGYQVAEKWLKDRKGRPLTPADKVHYAKIIVALGRTKELVAQIDHAIPAWPIS